MALFARPVLARSPGLHAEEEWLAKQAADQQQREVEAQAAADAAQQAAQQADEARLAQQEAEARPLRAPRGTKLCRCRAECFMAPLRCSELPQVAR